MARTAAPENQDEWGVEHPYPEPPMATGYQNGEASTGDGWE